MKKYTCPNCHSIEKRVLVPTTLLRNGITIKSGYAFTCSKCKFFVPLSS